MNEISQQIVLIEEYSLNNADELHFYARGAKSIFACDFHIEHAEMGHNIPGGYSLESLINIDHHAPTARMSKIVSSTNLAIDYVEAFGTAKEGGVILINHTDCDSILSSGIISGTLRADLIYAAAAIAADHTGVPNSIADLLQALRQLRSVGTSLKNLDRLLNDLSLDSQAADLLFQRLRERDEVAKIIETGSFTNLGYVTVIITESKIDAGLVPAFLPMATVILVATPIPNNRLWEVSLRLGLGRPDSLMLQSLPIAAFDPGYGGRWNAGSNRRGGGTRLAPLNYAQLLNKSVEIFLSQHC